LGLTILPTDVKLITKPEDVYQWSILTPGRAALSNRQLSKHSTGAYIELCNGVGVHFKAVLGKGAADYEPETRLVTTITAFDALEKSREHPSSDGITFQASAKEWRERFNSEVAIREALEIEMMGVKGENADLLTEMKALREEEATRIQKSTGSSADNIAHTSRTSIKGSRVKVRLCSTDPSRFKNVSGS
ncbi:hypothetical protein V493_01864, partial [Pseudogymnoascus sp. VKM F-4281 (FW-2241)]